MELVVKHMKAILIVCGALTCTMAYLAIAPGAALNTMFGTGVDGALANAIARNWGAVITLFGVALLVCAWRPQYRSIILPMAIGGKLMFIVTIIALGNPYLQHAMIAVVADALMIALFIVYLVSVRQDGASTS